jgi:hypothetical protein
VNPDDPTPGYPRDFFKLQLGFAEALAMALGRPFQDVLLESTMVRGSLSLRGWVDAQHPDWRAFLDGLDAARDLDGRADWTYSFYLERRRLAPPEPPARFGCFDFDYERERGTIRLHFRPPPALAMGPLGRDQVPQRLAELRALCAAARAEAPDAEAVRGGSWLYNIEAYRRLFPAAYLAAATIARPREELRFMALWGQFLHRGRVREPLATDFLAGLRRQRDLEGIEACFPFTVLRPRCPIREFAAFYG